MKPKREETSNMNKEEKGLRKDLIGTILWGLAGAVFFAWPVGETLLRVLG